MGESIAIKSYLRAMIYEHDENNIRMAGPDQGFHNYLYCSNKLFNCITIYKIIIWEQGYGIINNSSALRIKTLVEWNIYIIYNNK